MRNLLLLLIIILLLAVVTPLPIYEPSVDCSPCRPGDICPPCTNGTWTFRKPLFLNLTDLSKDIELPSQINLKTTTPLQKQEIGTEITIEGIVKENNYQRDLIGEDFYLMVETETGLNKILYYPSFIECKNIKPKETAQNIIAGSGVKVKIYGIIDSDIKKGRFISVCDRDKYYIDIVRY